MLNLTLKETISSTPTHLSLQWLLHIYVPPITFIHLIYNSPSMTFTDKCASFIIFQHLTSSFCTHTCLQFCNHSDGNNYMNMTTHWQSCVTMKMPPDPITCSMSFITIAWLEKQGKELMRKENFEERELYMVSIISIQPLLESVWLHGGMKEGFKQ